MPDTLAGREAPPMPAELRKAAEAATGFMPPAEGLALYRVAAAYAQVGPVLEVGTYCGKSTIYLAAAMTTGRTVELTVDRPFLFAITDAASGLPLFLGRVTDPSAA